MYIDDINSKQDLAKAVIETFQFCAQTVKSPIELAVNNAVNQVFNTPAFLEAFKKLIVAKNFSPEQVSKAFRNESVLSTYVECGRHEYESSGTLDMVVWELLPACTLLNRELKSAHDYIIEHPNLK